MNFRSAKSRPIRDSAAVNRWENVHFRVSEAFSDPPRAQQQERGRLRFQEAAGDGLLSCVYWISDADPERFAENRGLCRRIGMAAGASNGADVLQCDRAARFCPEPFAEVSDQIQP